LTAVNRTHFDVSVAILGALLDSIAPELAQLQSLDLTAQGLAKTWFESRSLSLLSNPPGVSPARTLATLARGKTFALVVCEPAQLGLIAHVLDPNGLLLVRTGHDDKAPLASYVTGYVTASTISDSVGAWHLLVPARAKAAPDFDLSVLMTCRDQARATLDAVCCLAEEITQARWELIIVDRESWDGTPALLQAIEGDVQQLRVARDYAECRALQHGFAHVRGSTCAIMDPRLRYTSGWLERVVLAHRHKPRAIFLGSCAFEPEPNFEMPIPPLAIPRDRLRELPLDDHWPAGPLFSRWLQGRDDIYAIDEWRAELEPLHSPDAA
jgi:hypothetical protein